MADASPKFHPQELLPPSPGPAVEVAVAHDGLSFWQFMVAGSIAGLVEHTAMFPVDTVKTRMQAQAPPCQPSLSLRQAVSSILRTEGPLGFYRGIGAMGLGAGPAHAVYFSVYEISKEFLSRGNPNNPVAHASSGVLATVASDAVFTPMDTVKQRLQLRSSPYKGVADCVRRVFREEGYRAFYASYRTTVVMNAPFTAVHFATYEAAKRALSEVSPDNADDERLVVHATAGAAAGALAASVTTPLDVVKTQLQCQGVCGCERFSSSSIMAVARAIIKRDGYAGLMRGWKPRMLFHAPAAAICWSAYAKKQVEVDDITEKWKSLNLPSEQLHELLQVGDFTGKVEWLKFFAVACASLSSDLTGTMQLLCEQLTADPEGGPARVNFDTWKRLYLYLYGLNQEADPQVADAALAYLAGDVERQKGVIQPRNFKHPDCPPLH